jgi:peptidoglycan/xylan/chitin deacetylase (PgdA/CDA1 family)
VTIQFAVAAVSMAVALNALSAPDDASRPTGGRGSSGQAPAQSIATILVYHRFGPDALDSMTVRTPTFRAQLEWLRQHHYRIVPLREVLDYMRGIGTRPSPAAIVLTADDGHRSVFTEMLPIVREYGVHVTVFVYPSAISNASYAMTWAQLSALAQTGLFDVQSHTYWHPNFKVEKRRLSPEAYDAFVRGQLLRSQTILSAKFGGTIDTIAWPFGLYDDDLLRKAAECGYVAGLTLDRRPVTAGDRALALPRFLVTDTVGNGFTSMLGS